MSNGLNTIESVFPFARSATSAGTTTRPIHGLGELGGCLTRRRSVPVAVHVRGWSERRIDAGEEFPTAREVAGEREWHRHVGVSQQVAEGARQGPAGGDAATARGGGAVQGALLPPD